MRLPRFSLAALLGMLVVASCLFVVIVNKSRRDNNERQASAMLKMLSIAEADFRSNDRDGNLVNDFWTADVYGLYGLVPVPDGESRVPPDTPDESRAIKLIERDVALADAQSQTALYGNARARRGGPHYGYVLRAFASQDEGDGSPRSLVNDTDGSDFYGPVHDRSGFAFIAFPTSRREGNLAFIVNADNTIWKYELVEQYVAEFTPLGPGVESASRVRGISQRPHHATLHDAAAFPASPGREPCLRD